MRLMYITKSMAPVGGLERVVCDKMNYMAAHGYEVTIVTYEQGRHPLAFPLDSRINHVDLDVRFFLLYRLPLWKRLLKNRQYRSRFRCRLQQTVDQLRPDVIIANTYSMNVADIIADLRTSARTVLESHVAFYVMRKSLSYRHNPVRRVLAWWYDRQTGSAVRRYDRLVALTRGDAADWQTLTDRVVVIPNPVTRYPAQLPSRTDSRRIVCVGRLTRQKGYDLLVQAFALIADQCPGWHVDIYGGGEEEDNLRRQIADSHLQQRILLHGPSADVYREYASSQFLVLSSRYEGFALVLVEAAACGVPAVAFRCKYGPEDIITDGKNGLLVPDGQVDCLAEKMLWMITHAEERCRMGAEARRMAAAYQSDVVMQQWERLFKEMRNEGNEGNERNERNVNEEMRNVNGKMEYERQEMRGKKQSFLHSFIYISHFFIYISHSPFLIPHLHFSFLISHSSFKKQWITGTINT